MIIVGLKPSCQTKFKFLKPKLMVPMEADPHHDHLKSDMHENLSGCLAWLPATKGPAGKKRLG
jgi:hypothetical protein